jgi:hypothetical protein
MDGRLGHVEVQLAGLDQVVRGHGRQFVAIHDQLGTIHDQLGAIHERLGNLEDGQRVTNGRLEGLRDLAGERYRELETRVGSIERRLGPEE